MRAAHVPDEALTPAAVPPPDAPLDELLHFAHRYHAYKVAGSLGRVGAIAVELHDRWTTTLDGDPAAVLDAPLAQLRIALFHTARALEHDTVPRAVAADGADAADAATWVRVLVRSVAAALPGDPTNPDD